MFCLAPRLQVAVQGPVLYLTPRLQVAVQGPVVYLAPRLQVAVQRPEVVGFAAASGSARTCCCIWLHSCKWQCKDQLLYWLHGCKWQCKDHKNEPRSYRQEHVTDSLFSYEDSTGFLSLWRHHRCPFRLLLWWMNVSMVENVIMYIRANKGSRPLSHMFFRFVNKVIQFFCIKSADWAIINSVIRKKYMYD